jgi:hypothetical protein
MDEYIHNRCSCAAKIEAAIQESNAKAKKYPTLQGGYHQAGLELTRVLHLHFASCGGCQNEETKRRTRTVAA